MYSVCVHVHVGDYSVAVKPDDSVSIKQLAASNLTSTSPPYTINLTGQR